MSRRDWDLIDVPERRAVAEQFEIRAAGDNIVKITGYASIFNRGYEVNGGPSYPDGWTEVVNPVAFQRTLSETPHVHLLVNHGSDGGLPLASTKSKTLRLAADSTGLVSEATLDRRNTRANDLVITLERGDADEMSFAFRVKAQTWSDDDTTRSLDEVSLHKGDVSVVNFGANPFTSVAVRNAVKTLSRSDLGPRELAEIRAMSEQADRAMSALRMARDDKPYGDVAYADPKNGKYPIDTKEHVKAAWSYINMPKNQKDYSPAELSEIKGRIKAAAEKFGIEISESNSRGLAPNIITGDKSVFTQQIHDLSVNAGADCDPTSVDGARAMSPLADYSEDLNDDEQSEEGEPRDSTLAQAIHDLCAEAGADCGVDEPVDDTPMDDPQTNSLDGPTGTLVDGLIDGLFGVAAIDGNMSVAAAGDLCPARLSLDDAAKLTVSDGNLSLAEAMRLCRPEDSPEPLSLVDAATRLAS